MPDTRSRLVQCFQAVFPDLNESDAARANANRVSAWDSAATVTLAAVVEEEFNMTFDPQEIEKLTSFDRYLSRLEQG